MNGFNKATRIALATINAMLETHPDRGKALKFLESAFLDQFLRTGSMNDLERLYASRKLLLMLRPNTIQLERGVYVSVQRRFVFGVRKLDQKTI